MQIFEINLPERQNVVFVKEIIGLHTKYPVSSKL